MNKYNIKDYLGEKLEKHLTTLKQASYDSSKNEFLCSDNVTGKVYSFDNYVEENFDKSKLPASPDAILLGKNKLYFVEFKNRASSKICKENMRDKFVRGTEILKDMLKDFSPKDVKFIFCIVYKNERYKYFNSSHIETMATRFGLEEENQQLGNFYTQIIGNDVEFYKHQFKQLQC